MTSHGPRSPRRLAAGPLGGAIAGFAAAACLLAVSACAGRGATVQAPVELAIAPIGSLPEGGIRTNGQQSSGGRCSLRLVAARIEKSSPGCYLDEHISDGPGLLHYPCAGDGEAEAEFGEHRYAGRVVDGEVELELSTELDWEDGCRWGTRALITGTLVSNGELTLKRLSWRYVDRVITGADCSGVCTAKSTIDVTRANGRPLPPRPPDDDDDDEEWD